MTPIKQFLKAAPTYFEVREQAAPDQSYKYFVKGKGCTLGVLFESSVNVHFEWLYEDGELVDYEPRIRYKSWSKREFARLVNAGVWDIVGSNEVPA